MLKYCPYCAQALEWQRQLIDENPQYRNIKVEIIDESEQRSLADSYDYYLVPAYFVDDKKMHEGVAEKNKIAAVFDAALS